MLDNFSLFYCKTIFVFTRLYIIIKYLLKLFKPYTIYNVTNMVKCVIIHNKHEGCYDFQFYEDETAKMRLTSITINPPKIFMFDSREQAQDFFEEYINDVDVLDIRCKKGDEVVHIDYCTCGIIELDEDENPILFYNKKIKFS